MTPPSGAATIDGLVQTLQRCWPEADRVELVRSSGRAPGRGTGSDTEVLEFAAVPNAASARLAVPVGRRAGRAALARYSAALSGREVLQRLVAAAAISVVGPVMLRDRIRVVGPGEDHIGAVVASIVGEPVQLSLGIGTARANRKPVLGAFDRRGRPVAFVKVGDTAVSARHVVAEARALQELGRHDWSVIVVPELLGHTQWRGMEVVVMSALPARPRRGGVAQRWPIPDAAMSELGEAFCGGVAPLVDTPWWGSLPGAVAALADSAHRERVAEVLDRIERTVGEVEVRVGAWHGDFTPWNMSRHGGHLLVWDWERFDTGVPRGMDRLHYAVNTLSLERSFGVATVLEGLRRGATGEGHVDLAVAAAYLTALSIRYLSGAGEEGGSVVADRAELVLTVLDELSRHLGPTRAGSPSR